MSESGSIIQSDCELPEEYNEDEDVEEEMSEDVSEHVHEYSCKSDHSLVINYDSKFQYHEENGLKYDIEPISLDKNDYIITSKGMSKIVEVIDEEDKENAKFKIDFQGKKEIIAYKNLKYSVSKEIKVKVITHENRLFDIKYPVNINDTFEGFFETFCEDHILMTKQVCLIYRNSKISKKEKEKLKFSKDFDFEKDTIIMVVGPSTENHHAISKNYKRLQTTGFQTYKYLLKVDKPVFLTALYLYAGYYEDSTVIYRDIVISEVNNIPEVEVEKDIKDKSKKKKNKSGENINIDDFDDFFKTPAKFEIEEKQNFNNFEIFREYYDREESDSENEEEEYDVHTFESRMKKLEIEKILIDPGKYYYISLKMGGNQNRFHATHSKFDDRFYISKDNKNDIRFKFIIAPEQGNSLVIGGLSWIPKSCFS